MKKAMSDHSENTIASSRLFDLPFTSLLERCDRWRNESHELASAGIEGIALKRRFCWLLRPQGDRGGSAMCRRWMRVLLMVIGSALVFLAATPFLAFVHFEESLRTELMASKLLLLPVGAIFLAVAAFLSRDGVRH
jgi:hypothetical protein